MDLELEDAKTGQKWSPFQPKANSRQQLRAKQQEKIFLKRAERVRKMKELGLVPDDNYEMGPSLPDERDDDFVPDDQEDESDQDNDEATDNMLQDDLAEVEAETDFPVDPEADEADYETIEDDTQLEEEDDDEVELTEEEKAAKAAADAAEAARLEQERIKREEQERKQRERDAIQRRKEQILELRKMALEDRAARKASRQNARSGLLEAEADESGSDFSDDDDEASAERQAIEELRGIDYLAGNDNEDENAEAQRELYAKQAADDMESYLKQRGDVFDDDGKIIRHGRAMRKLLRQAQEEDDDDAVAKQLANQSDSDSDDDSSDSDDGDDAPSSSSLAGTVSTSAAAAAGAGTSRAFAFASQGVGAAAVEPTTDADASSTAAGDGLTEKQRKKLRKKNIKRMRRAVGSTLHLRLLASWLLSSLCFGCCALWILSSSACDSSGVFFPCAGISKEPFDCQCWCCRREDDGGRGDEHARAHDLSFAVGAGSHAVGCYLGCPTTASNAAAPQHLYSRRVWARFRRIAVGGFSIWVY